jgi:hypothetical protein|tara:strand:- start:158 stop:415 length:258 start_codon:yes stop_codon:yes gene_type:complete
VYKEGNMPRYVLDYAGLRDFESADPSGVVDVMKTIMGCEGEETNGLLSIFASNVCDQVNKPIRFGNIDEFTEDLLKHKVLKETSQ